MATIDVQLMRISNDSKYLEFILKCPTDFRINQFIVKSYPEPFSTESATSGTPANGDFSSTIYNTYTTNEVTGRIALDQLKGDKQMYQISMTATNLDATEQTDTKVVIVSDTNFVYYNLERELLELSAKCIEDLNIGVLTRDYMLLYAHETAMRAGEFITASEYYQLMLNNFSACEFTDENLNLGIRRGCSCND